MGFRYAYDPHSKQFAHASAIMVLTPKGKISRYFYGIQYPSRDLRLGLVEASEGKIGHPGRSSAALLLSLRCVHREIRAADIASDSSRRGCNRVGHCGTGFGASPKRTLRVARTKSVTTLSAAGNCVSKRNWQLEHDRTQSNSAHLLSLVIQAPQLRPEAASSIAEGVDHLYFVLTFITFFFYHRHIFNNFLFHGEVSQAS